MIPISYEERGKEIGRVEIKREIALKMLKEGFGVDMIMKFTELEQNEINRLRGQD